MKLLPSKHRLIANAKAVFSGPHHGVSSKHFQQYLGELFYRFFIHWKVFHRLLRACKKLKLSVVQN